MGQRPSILERAFELARSGEGTALADLRDRLNREGYEFAYGHTSGSLVMRQLKAEFLKAKSTSRAGPLAAVATDRGDVDQLSAGSGGC